MNGNLLTSLSFLNSSDNDHGFDWLIETTVTENKEVLQTKEPVSISRRLYCSISIEFSNVILLKENYGKISNTNRDVSRETCLRLTC